MSINLENILRYQAAVDDSIDVYASGTLPLYTPDDPFSPIGGFGFGSPGNLFQRYGFDDLAGDPSLKGYELEERYDFSGLLGGNSSDEPHLNQDIFKSGEDDPAVNSGTSRKNEDGFKGLGPAHQIFLFPKKW